MAPIGTDENSIAIQRRAVLQGVTAALAGGNTIGGWIREADARADGYRHVDTPAMITRLVDLGVNTYFYGIWDSPTDWDDLRNEFLPAARDHDIKVMPYVVPPSETDLAGRASHPFVNDYVAWAKALAELSLEYPNLIGWAIDDFEFDVNAELFTHDYMTQMRAAQDAINPLFTFLTCAYWGAATSPRFLDKYAPFIDAIVYPYLDGDAHNTQVSTSVEADLDAITAVAEPRGVATILLVYAGRFLTSQLRPTEDYAADSVRRGLAYTRQNKIAGVVAYGTQVDGAPTPASENLAMYGNGRLSLATPHGAVVPEGQYAEAAQTVTVDPHSARYELSFWHFRAFAAKHPERGDYVISVLIGGEVVYQSDVLGKQWFLWINGHDSQGPVDVTEQLRGKSTARLAFRLTAARDVAHTYVDVGIDHIEPIGFNVTDPGFETGDGWRLAPERGPILAAVDIYAPDRPERIFRALAHEFR